jgi:hypothetical protein
MKRWTPLALIGVVSVSAACASILGIEGGVFDPALGVDGGDSGPPTCIADGGGHPDTSIGIFVAKGGTDNGSCGSEDHPCLTIGYALGIASGTTAITTVYVATGIYNETVALKPGITIEGGWVDVGGVWDRVCSVSDPAQAAVITGSSEITIQAEDLNALKPGAATLRFLNIDAKTPDPGKSLYGIYAGGVTELLLDNVILNIGDAGDGKDGDAGMAGVSPPNGDCTPGNGVSPEAGGAPGGPADPPILTDGGIITQTGDPGTPGSAGNNGPLGAAGGCVGCKNCVAVTNCNTTATPSCGTEGNAGCAGGAGSGGFPGQSGGSSIGIFAWGPKVVVTVIGGKIATGFGGRGGAGGPAGAGGIGSLGFAGDAGPSCLVSCSTACLGTNTSGAGTGGEGSKGGNGSSGGLGGGGAGGDSFAIVLGADASVLVDGGVDLKPGHGGASASGGSGQSGVYNP